MTHLLIFTFFGVALAAGLYCLWVALRAELTRAPRFLHFRENAYRPAVSSAGTAHLAGRPAHRSHP